jgi:glycosyltransferase involved in cell wall biosynthesis
VRVLVVSQYFHPEMTAASLRLRPLGAGLVERGHEVDLVCEIPNHPRGVVDPDFRGHAVVRRDVDGIDTRYVWVRASPSKQAPARLAAYASYAALATMTGARLPRPDVVFASSPPLSVGVVGSLLARRYRVPFVLDVRDLWPAVAGALGEVSSSRVLGLAQRLERHLYRGAAAVTTVTEPFAEHIGAIADPGKVHLLPNGTTAAWLGLADTEVEREEVGLPGDRFVWTYAGNVGLSQGLETAIEAAERLGSGFRLLILGEGASRERLRRLAAALPDGAVEFRDAVPAETAARYMRASDALLVSLSPDPVLAKTVPIKLYDSCAVGRPVLVSAPGEAQRLASEEGAGIPLPPGDAEALADAVRGLAGDEGRRAEAAQQARRFAAEHLRERQVPKLERVLAEAAARGR